MALALALGVRLLCGEMPAAADPGYPAPGPSSAPDRAAVLKVVSPPVNLSTPPVKFLADDKEIPEDQFYVLLGRPDLRASLRRRTRVRDTSRILGTVFGGLGFLSVVAALPVVASEIPRSSPDWVPAVGGLLGTTGGLALFSVTFYLISAQSPHPIERSEMQDLASRHNRGRPDFLDRPVPFPTDPPGPATLPTDEPGPAGPFDVSIRPSVFVDSIPAYGSLSSAGGDLGSWTLEIDACQSGDHHDFHGVDLFPHTSTKSRLRVVVDALRGRYGVAIRGPGAASPRIFEQEQCSRFDIRLETSDTRIGDRRNGTRPVSGSLDLSCTYQASEKGEGHVQGRVTFDRCY